MVPENPWFSVSSFHGEQISGEAVAGGIVGSSYTVLDRKTNTKPMCQSSQMEGKGHKVLIFRNTTFLCIIYSSRLKLKHIFIEGKTISLFLKTCANKVSQGFPGSSVVMNSPDNARDTGDMSSIPRLGRSPGEENGNPLQYSRLENPMGRGA